MGEMIHFARSDALSRDLGIWERPDFLSHGRMLRFDCGAGI